MYKTTFILFLAFFLTSCGAKRALETTEEVSTEDYGLARALAAYDENSVTFDTFSAKIKCKFEDDSKSLSFKTTVRVQKDEKIWISAGILGFEGVRALITPDSVKVINRLEKTYFEEPIDKLQEFSGLPVDFSMMQQLVTGKLLLLNTENASITQKEGIYELISSLGDMTAIAWLDDATFDLERQTVIEQAQNTQMEITYHAHDKLENFIFPYESNVHVSGDEEIWVDMEFSDVELNEQLSFPFTINRNYDREEL